VNFMVIIPHKKHEWEIVGFLSQTIHIDEKRIKVVPHKKTDMGKIITLLPNKNTLMRNGWKMFPTKSPHMGNNLIAFPNKNTLMRNGWKVFHKKPSHGKYFNGMTTK